jgi:hypothetical protein
MATRFHDRSADRHLGVQTAVSRRWWIAIASCLYALHALAVAPLVSAELEPQQISVGQSAQLTITTSGMNADQIALPQVAGLEFRVVGQSRRLEIINGTTFDSTSIIVRVSADAPGIYTIPGITPRSQPLVLRVNPDTGASGPAAVSPSISSSTTSSGIRLTADGSAVIRLNLPRRDVYVGESIPVDIEVGMRAGFVTSLNGLPTLSGGEFTLNNLTRQPERVEKVIDGKPFILLTWHSVLAPVKPGVFSLAVSSPITIRVRTQAHRDSMIDDLLGDPFMQNFFGATVPKDITITSPTTDLTVLALPSEGRPADFSGAVGTFKSASDLSATNAAVGDPLTLKLRVTGSGNFDRVDSPMLEHVDQWKTYPPKSSFAAGDAIGYKGEKTFEQPVVATHPGAQTLPGLAFSYFDPSTRKYETLHSAPLEVSIAPSLAQSTLTASQPGPTASDTPSPLPNSLPGLKADHAVTDTFTTSLVPLYLRRGFLWVPSLLTLAFAGAWFALHRRATPRRVPTPRERITSAWAKRVLEQMDAAAQAGNSVLYLNTARSALQQKLAARWAMAPEDITTTEVGTRVPGDAIHDLFAQADEVNYAGNSLKIDFARWSQIMRNELSEEAAA